MSPPALLFDLDGTLVDSARGIAAALSTLSSSRGGGPVTHEMVKPLVSRGVATLVSASLGQWARGSLEDVQEFRAILESLPVDPDCIFSGVRTTLETLAARGHLMAVVTNKPERLGRHLLAQLNLLHFFEIVVGGDTVGISKPHAAPLHYAVARLCAEAGGAIMIGDSEVDGIAAYAASLPFGLFLGGYGPRGNAAYEIAFEFAEFGDLLNRQYLGEAQQVRSVRPAIFSGGSGAA